MKGALQDKHDVIPGFLQLHSLVHSLSNAQPGELGVSLQLDCLHVCHLKLALAFVRGTQCNSVNLHQSGQDPIPFKVHENHSRM